MDPLQSQQIDDSDNKDPNTIIVIGNAEEVRIQLEGSHTTSTETEPELCANKKNVKFQNVLESEQRNFKEDQNNEVKDLEKIEEKKEKISVDEQSFGEVRVTKEVHLEEHEVKQQQNEQSEAQNWEGEAPNQASEESSNQAKMQNISSERNEVSQRLEQIIDMFDSFTKNLENMDIRDKPRKVKADSVNRNNNKRFKMDWVKEQQREVEKTQEQRNSQEECFKEDKNKKDTHDTLKAVETPENVMLVNHCSNVVEVEQIEDYLKQQEMACKELENDAKERKAAHCRNISTATSSCELKSLGCQTYFSDLTSLNELSLMEVSSLTSRSDQMNSLNNYAQAENACVSYSGSQQDIEKQPLIQQPLSPTPAPVTLTEAAPTTATFSVITIEANRTPSSADVRRVPFCQRLWELIGDFCAATFLCLQVNRDFIYCLGFIVAFVVSASFLTAFFYHAILLSPSLWQTDESQQH